MDDLKNKFLGFINKQGTKIPPMGFSDEIYHTQATATLSVNSKTAAESDRPADQDILESIEAAYFSMNEAFDISRFELTKLPEILSCDHIERDFKTLKQQHQVVSKKVLQLILQQQTTCNEEFQNIIQIKNQLSDTIVICREGRSELDTAKRQFITSLGILANYRKRQLVQNLLHSLNTIKTLHCTEDRLQELLNEENYPGAITLLQECRAAATTYRHFNCVAALTHKLQETLDLAEEQLDQALAKICLVFDATTFSKLQTAYRLLGKTQIAMNQLLMHYTSAIHNTAFSIVHSYATRTEGQDGGGKRQYEQLCTSVPQENFISCLIELCKSLFSIMLSYYQLVGWYNRMNGDEMGNSDGGQVNLEENFDKQYIKTKLENGLSRVWYDVQSKISAYLMNSDLASYKFEQFVQVLSIVHRLIEVGEEFSGSKSEDLQESIRKQSYNYFKNYHNSRLEELKIFLENESWEICPVKSKFDILQLQEFKPLRHVLKNYKNRSINTSSSTQPISTGINSPDCNSSNHSQDGSSVSGNYFNRFSYGGTPFDSRLDETIFEEDFLADATDEASGYCSEDSEDEADELKKDFIDEYADENLSKVLKPKKDKHNVKAPILTNTTLTVLRQIGKYLQMSRLLRPIAFDIICCMNQLFDFYLYAVHSFFASDLTIASTSLYSIKLQATLNRITDTLIQDPNPVDENPVVNKEKMFKPRVSPVVNLTQPEQLHGLAERIVAVESLVFLSRQFESLQNYLEHLVSPPNKIMLQQFYNQTINIASDLRRPVYMAVVAQAFDLRQILIQMSKVNWEVKDVMSQHSTYIDILLREIQIFTMRMEDVSSKVSVPKEIYNALWENIAHIVTHTLVEGFAIAKKCSNGGRGLMQLDFTQLQSKFEKISGLRPMPHKEYVENYVKAYYLPENELEEWIQNHNEYSGKHLFSLINCSCQNNKKTRQKLTNLLNIR